MRPRRKQIAAFKDTDPQINNPSFGFFVSSLCTLWFITPRDFKAYSPSFNLIVSWVHHIESHQMQRGHLVHHLKYQLFRQATFHCAQP